MNKMVSNNQIIFLTTTIGTKWIFYQQYLLNKFFPEASKVLIDGNLRWNFEDGLDCVWYDFIRIALENGTACKYFVHIDEDCFITDPEGIYDMLNRLEEESLDLIGPSDVVPRLRGENPLALNSFIMAGKISSLAEVMENYDINLRFNNLGITINPPIEEYKVEYEPYYEFFWNYYKKGFKIGFIKTGYDENYYCTSLIASSGNCFGYHMWLTRNWYSKKMTPLGVANYTRYKKMELFLTQKFNITTNALISGFKNWSGYRGIIFSRVVSKNMIRIKRRAVKFLNSGKLQ
jgi:hypothetical protein